ncbi:bifunctional GrpB family protein/GNAT family N-acetyltransferase [Legionella jordanis]|uniref:Multifunctional nucleotidyltransferase/glutamate rich protein GrpB/ribosomal protein alanine acetyltransferase n=1 Tax=Legionella jordanis TaxID=456 RepID=A0A0W0VDT3_9GAMM|nr:bifunctional GrpB family protein/GNAT family N-acetyltransferase [Legionella jordanis]KTD18250.1 multifunctional nucleotidyltransferase/glutamate rich protein GrpB/ribosomal protein alanine acetyltransferase [Legionella jordanis]RMX01205.1 GNAT family N-acetyltransferase [Legionella jordanis]VEH13656.1 nucleotidyltransferase PLUS glutamate rich protein GrpB PLUS ribosomal protein alanine acetyltransferase [Legionella jordanis]
MITLEPHNPAWKAAFEVEKEQLLQLGIRNITQIEHIGSTAIPGICAKPVIDILIGVKCLSEFTSEYIQKIESLDYRYNPVFETVFPHRRYFQKDNEQGERTHQIHLVTYPSSWYAKHLLFRDYLCLYPNVANEYEVLKLNLSKIYDNTIDYANAKNEFCQLIDKKAFLHFGVNKPFIETARLIAFIPQVACHKDYAIMLSNPEFIQCYGVSYNEDQALNRLESDMTHYNQYGFAPWMWYDKETHNYVGRGGLKTFISEGKEEVELTYQIAQSYWGKGLAFEIGQASLEYAEEHLDLASTICFTAYNNYPSLRVMEKLGFKFEFDFEHAGITHKFHRKSTIKKL